MSIADRLDDAMSPIVVKELRQAVQSRLVVSVLLLFLLVQLVVMGMFLVGNSIGGRLELADYQAGREVFAILQGFLLGTCMLFLPAYSGLRLAAERSDTNVDLLFITTLPPRAIISGKVIAALVLAVMIFSACMPFMAFTYFLRGIDVPSIAFVIGLDFLVVMASVFFAIFLAVVPVNRVLKALLALWGLSQLIYLFAGTVAGTVELTHRGVVGLLEDRDALYAVGGLLLGAVGILGLLFTWSVALVQAPSANRAWPTRLVVTLFWAVMGVYLVVYAGTSWRLEAAFICWIIGSGLLLTLCLAIAINEREQWAPRVARTIPRWGLLRIPAFFFYSGAAGGVLHAVLLAGLTALVVWWWLELWLPAGGAHHLRDGVSAVADAMLMIFSYTYAYGLTAVLLRRTVLSRVQPIHTWVLALVLAAVGSVVPLLIGVLSMPGRWQFEENYFLMLPNPVAAATFIHDRGNEARLMFHLFIFSWCGLVTLLNVPWFYDQMARFKPYVPREAAPLPVAELVPEAAESE